MNAFFQVDTCRRRTDSAVESSSPEAFLGGVLIIVVLNYAPQRGPREAQGFITWQSSVIQSLKDCQLQWHTSTYIWQIWATRRYCMLLSDYAFVIHLSDISQRSGLENRFDAIVTKTLVKNQFLHVSMIWSICKMPETFSDTKRRRGLLAGWGWWWDVYKFACLHVFLSLRVSFFIVFSVYF